MTSALTIHEAAERALKLVGKPSSLDEIYRVILEHGLYEFNTPTPEHVLRTEIRRYTKNVERSDSRERSKFEMLDDELYKLISEEKRVVNKTAKIGAKRILRSSDKEPFIRELMSDHVGVFKEIWRLLLFAAQIGVANKRSEPLGAIETGKGIDQSTFGNCPSWPGVLYLIALAETGNSDSLSGSATAEEARIASFQEYANGGLSVLKEFFSDRAIDIDGLLAFIESQTITTLGKPNLDLSI